VRSGLVAAEFTHVRVFSTAQTLGSCSHTIDPRTTIRELNMDTTTLLVIVLVVLLLGGGGFFYSRRG